MMSKGLTTDSDLRKMAVKLHVPLVFVGFKDLLERVKPRVGAYIINLQDSDDGNGTHWTCFFLTKDKQAFYFDSYGAPPPEVALKYMSRWTKKIYANNEIVQDPDGAFCGQYCLNFLTYMTRNPTKAGAKHFLQKFKLTRLI